MDTYVHSGGRIGALVELNCETDFVARTDEFRALVHDLALQVAAMNPAHVSKDDLPPDSALNPEEVCLLQQPFIKDPSMTVQDLVNNVNAKTGENIQVRRFTASPSGRSSFPMASAYHRVVLKLSGEALSGPVGYGIDAAAVAYVAGQIKAAWQTGIQLAVVVGGGNIWRGQDGAAWGMDRATADNAGMLATVINVLALQDALERADVVTRAQSAIVIQPSPNPSSAAVPFATWRREGSSSLEQAPAPLHEHRHRRRPPRHGHRRGGPPHGQAQGGWRLRLRPPLQPLRPPVRQALLPGGPQPQAPGHGQHRPLSLHG